MFKQKDGVNHILDMVGRFQGQGPLADNLKKYANNTGDPNIHAQPDVIVFSTTELEDSKDLARYFAFHKEKCKFNSPVKEGRYGDSLLSWQPSQQ